MIELREHFETGCSGWIRINIPPGNNRMDYCYPDRAMKLVSAAGLAPAVARSQAEHVAATPRAVAPANGWCRGLVYVEMESARLGQAQIHRRLADPKGLAPSAFPQTTGCSAIELRVRMVGSGGNAPLVHFRLCFATPVLQTGSRNASRKNW